MPRAADGRPDPEVDLGEVDGHEDIGAFCPRRPHEAAVGPPSVRQHRQRLGQPGGREPRVVGGQVPSRRREPAPAQAEDLRAGAQPADFADQGARVQVAGRLAARDHHLGCRHRALLGVPCRCSAERPGTALVAGVGLSPARGCFGGLRCRKPGSSCRGSGLAAGRSAPWIRGGRSAGPTARGATPRRLGSPRPVNAGGRGSTGPARARTGPRCRRTPPAGGRARTPAPRPRARSRGGRSAGGCAPRAGCPRP